MLSRAANARVAGAIVERLDPNMPSVVSAGTGPWANVLRLVPNALDEYGLLTFALVLALRVEDFDSEYLIQQTFERVYDGLVRWRIPPRMFDALREVLPAVQDWKEWDKCYRLVLAVAKVYVERQLDADRFAAGISSWYTRRRFLRMVKGLRRGPAYVDPYENDPLE
jgi:hypothetical protein